MNSQLQNISLYIPRVFANFDTNFIANVFEELNIGNVRNVDIVEKIGKDGKIYNSAYVHFNYWYDGTVAENFHARVLDPNKEARIVYQDPWYWNVYENKGKKYVRGERRPCIDLSTNINTNTNTNINETEKTTISQIKEKDEYIMMLEKEIVYLNQMINNIDKEYYSCLRSNLFSNLHTE